MEQRGAGRVEAFSDGVFAIVITLLVLDLRVPAYEPGGLGEALRHAWPSYVAFTVSFVYIGILWLNHRALFKHIRSTSLGLNWVNLGLLFGAVILPFPTAVLAEALGEAGDETDLRVAVIFYAAVAAFMSATWLVLFVYLDRHRGLLEPESPTWARAQFSRPITGVVLYLLAVLIAWLASPELGLISIVFMIIYHAVTSEGVHESPLARLRRPRPPTG